MNFYVSDLLFSKEGNPASDEELIFNWNAWVSSKDNVYILGNFCCGDVSRWVELLDQLQGQKFLVLGDRDPALSDMAPEVKKRFVKIDTMLTVSDKEKRILLCHYPIITYPKNRHPDCLMFYGHVQDSTEYQLVRRFQAEEQFRTTSLDPHLYNCWCGLYGWHPATLEQVLARGDADAMTWEEYSNTL